mmetsp:Transcript_4235/g.5641  ORF Transcript_4235/g.5641 Transcript_4235/m.5641 type:complete len:95 (+) Transcript_4235:24-308(+)
MRSDHLRPLLVLFAARNIARTLSFDTNAPVLLQCWTSEFQWGFRSSVPAFPTIQHACLALVSATFIRRTSARNPIPWQSPERTHEKMITSFSPP